MTLIVHVYYLAGYQRERTSAEKNNLKILFGRGQKYLQLSCVYLLKKWLQLFSVYSAKNVCSCFIWIWQRMFAVILDVFDKEYLQLFCGIWQRMFAVILCLFGKEYF